MSPPQRENLYPDLPITAPFPPNSRLDKTYQSLSGPARALMLADLQKHRDERLIKLSSNSKTIPTTSTTTPSPPRRGTKRYCTWRCKSWRRHRSETVRECKCDLPHDIVHPSEWGRTPAEAAWDYNVGVRNGGWGYRERKVRFQDPVVTDVLEGEEESGEESEEESEKESEEESEEKSEEESEESEEESEEGGEEDEEEDWVMVGRFSWNWDGYEWVRRDGKRDGKREEEVEKEDVVLRIERGGVGDDPNEEMEDVFEELEPCIYLGTGVLEDTDTPRRQRY